MNKNYNKLINILFIITIIAMASASIIQLFFPNFLGLRTGYGLNIGWQREIGIWNLGIISILIGAFLKGDEKTLKIIAPGIIILGIGFGTNHLLAFFKDSNKYMSLFGAVENYILVGLFIYGLKKRPK